MDPMKDPKWNGRPKSRLVMVIQQEARLTSQELADALGISVPYLNNKLNRNSFSFDDMVKVANKAGYDLCFCKQRYCGKGSEGVINATELMEENDGSRG